MSDMGWFLALTEWGADTREAVERFVGDEELYYECLVAMANDENVELLARALAANDLSLAFRAAHTLKGVSANLGLTPLTVSLTRLTELLRVGSAEGVPEAYAPISPQIARLRQILGA